MQLKGMEFDFDFSDTEDLQRFEKAHEALLNTDTTGEKASEVARKQCAAAKTFFDTVLGVGAYEKLVDKPTSTLSNNNAIWDFVEAYQQAVAEAEKQQRQRLDKFKKYTAGRRRT